jgi:hypothetical protein
MGFIQQAHDLFKAREPDGRNAGSLAQPISCETVLKIYFI